METNLENRASFLSGDYKPKFARELKIQHKKQRRYISKMEMLIIAAATGASAAILGYELYCQIAPDILQYCLRRPF